MGVYCVNGAAVGNRGAIWEMGAAETGWKAVESKVGKVKVGAICGIWYGADGAENSDLTSTRVPTVVDSGLV